MGRHEIRDLLGLVRQRVYQITQQPDFPAPVAELSTGPVWDGAAVRTWHATREARRNRVKAEPKEA